MAKRGKQNKTKKNNLIYYLSGFLLIFGVSGLIYGLLPYPLIIGPISIVVGFILVFILVIRGRKKKQGKA